MSNQVTYKSLVLQEDIRLLFLHKGSGSDPLVCKLLHAEFARRPFYEAVSYTWGSECDPKPLTVNDSRVHIRSNLWDALWHLRKEDRGRILWVDALCINQEDVQERNHQVALMSQIYTNAIDVLAWVGPERDDSNLAMDRLEGTQNLSDLNTSNPREQRALEALFEREYWNRMWILQEVSLASHVIIHCGSRSVNWEVSNFPSDGYYWNMDYPFSHMNFKYRSGIGYKILLYRLERQINTTRKTLKELLMEFGDAQCADPRDKIFALLGMASDCQAKAIVADYSKTLFQVYHEVINFYYPLSHDSSQETSSSYDTWDAIELSQSLQRQLGGPFELPLHTEPSNSPSLERFDSVNTVSPPGTEPTSSALPKNDEVAKFLNRTLLPTSGRFQKSVYTPGLGLTASDDGILQAVRSTLASLRRLRRGCNKISEIAPACENDTSKLSKNATPLILSLEDEARRISDYPEDIILEYRFIQGSFQLPNELTDPKNLKALVVKGSAGFSICFATLDVRPSDVLWELEHAIYMGIFRFLPKKGVKDEGYQVVGKALLFNDDRKLMTPELREKQVNFGVRIFDSDGDLIPLRLQTEQWIEDRELSLRLDIANLQSLTC